MRIDNIKIRNFKGFEYKEFQLNPNFTVAIGNNGLGKSTLLYALQVGLGAILQSMPTLPANYIYRRQFKKGERYIKYWPDRKDYLPNKENPRIEILAYGDKLIDGNLIPLKWEREYLLSNSTTHKYQHSIEIIQYIHEIFDNHGSRPNILYPVLASFQINRISSQVRKIDKSWRKMSRLQKGYYSALGESVDFTGVYEWLYSYETSLRDDKEFEGTREAWYNAIKTAIPYILEIEYNRKFDEFEILVDYKDGQPVERKLYTNLNDGMKAMFNVVAEIAYRCIMLNGKLGRKAVELSSGIVLIDELDMCLHPKWQRHIIDDLKKAFPNIQFIATTHSPFIVQSLKSDELRNLDEVKGLDADPDRYSIEEVSSNEMGIENVERSNTFLQMQNDAKEYFNLIKAGASQESIRKAKIKLDELRIKYNNDPAYVALLESELPK